jgi:hypothetical protein
MNNNQPNIIIYNTADGKAEVSLYAKDGSVWMNQNQLATLFDTSKQNISLHVINILKENELVENSVVKDYLTTASDGKDYKVTFYSLDTKELENKLKSRERIIYTIQPTIIFNCLQL